MKIKKIESYGIIRLKGFGIDEKVLSVKGSEDIVGKINEIIEVLNTIADEMNGRKI